MAGDCNVCPLAKSGRRETVASKGEHSERWTCSVQHQRQRLSADRGDQLSGRGRRDPLLRDARRVRQDRCGDGVMDATLILIDSDTELARANALVEKLMTSDDPA